MKLTAKAVLEYQERIKGLKTIGQFKELGREIRDRHNLTDRQAIDVLNNQNVTTILADQEGRPTE